MDNSELKNLQCVQLEIMDEVHRVCVENDIKYYIIGGTALGAVRHGGLIPWDLDIDIAMPREDYEKFGKISPEKLSSGFVYRDYKNTYSFTHPHSLVCMANTFLSVKSSKFNPKEKNLGIYLDIFPLDKAPEGKKLQVKQANKIKKLRKLKILKRAYRYGSDNKLKCILRDVVSSLILWTSLDKINEDFDKLCRKYESMDSQYVCSMSSHYSYAKQCMPFSIYGKPRLVKFEDREYYAPEQLEEYLTRIFGDYMKLPPESEQKANLDVFSEVRYDSGDDNSDKKMINSLR